VEARAADVEEEVVAAHVGVAEVVAVVSEQWHNKTWWNGGHINFY
jgi:hypothetical protein